MKKYFVIGSDKWKVTVKWCIAIGFVLGIISGLSILLDVL